jgi:hypothetical protein
METRRFTKGDTLRFLAFALRNADGSPCNLSTATVVELLLVPDRGGTPKINYAACVMDDSDHGIGHYEWADEDIDTAGAFWAYVRRTVGGKFETFPPEKLFRVIIWDPLA